MYFPSLASLYRIRTMTKPKISIIAAISKEKRALGVQNRLLWKIEGDLPRFKKLTTGHPIIMGRKTYESIGRPLPNRINIVITRNPDFKAEGVLIASSIEEALSMAKEKEEQEIFIIGGGEIYKQGFPFANRLYLTIVEDEPEADVFFPDYSDFKKIIEKEDHLESNPPFSYITLER